MMNQEFCIKQPNGRYRSATPNEIMEAASNYAARQFSMIGQQISSPTETEKYLKGIYKGLQREKFGVLYLDNRHRIIAFEFPFSGTVDGTSVYPREIVKRVLELNASAIILSHNHPTGVPEPSHADERITRRIKSALELIDVRLLDHLVIGADNCTSLAVRGLL